MAVLREKGSAASEFPGIAPLCDAQRSIPRALLDGEAEDAAHGCGLMDNQEAEVAMLMDETAVDFHFLQRCGQNTEVRKICRVPLMSLWPTPPSQHATRPGAPAPYERSSGSSRPGVVDRGYREYKLCYNYLIGVRFLCCFSLKLVSNPYRHKARIARETKHIILRQRRSFYVSREGTQAENRTKQEKK